MPNGRQASRSRDRIPEIPGVALFAVGLAWAAGGAQCSASVLVLRNYDSKRMHDRNTSISPASAFSSQLSSYRRSITILVTLPVGDRDSGGLRLALPSCCIIWPIEEMPLDDVASLCLAVPWHYALGKGSWWAPCAGETTACAVCLDLG